MNAKQRIKRHQQKPTGAIVLPVEKTLSDLGLDKRTSKLAQDIAALPEDKIEAVKQGARGYGKSGVTNQYPTLEELGLDKRTSKLAQDIAALPEEKLEAVQNEQNAQR